MWHAKLEHYERPDGTTGKIGWILVDDTGQPYKDPEHGEIVTDFAPEPMQALASRLNSLQASRHS